MREFSGTLLRGTAALAAAMVLERGLAFSGSFLAARWGGAATLGAYTLAITTALNIAAYTGAGIGTTATRFAGEHPRDTPEYRAVSQALLLVAAVSAAVAAVLLWAAAEPVARLLLNNPGLAPLLRTAALAAAGAILLECCRGFLIGVRRYGAVLLMASVFGAGLAFGLPLASRLGPLAMVAAQAAAALAAVGVCLTLMSPLGFSPLARRTAPFGSAVRSVWTFGLMQLGTLIAANAAGWWLTTLVARADTTLVSMGLLAIGLQLRNMVGLLPNLLTQSGYSLFVGGRGPADDTPDRALSLCTALASLSVLAAAGGTMLLLPWLLPFAYGRSYAAAVVPTALLLATGIAHMGGAPASARLTIVSVRRAGLVNLIWAGIVALGATCAIPFGGVRAAALTYLIAHLFSVVFVLVALGAQHVPATVRHVSAWTCGGAIVLGGLAVVRDGQPEQAIAWTALMAAVLVGALAGIARRTEWPVALSLPSLTGRVRGLLRERLA